MKNKKLFLIQPLEHGNGGWHGYNVLSHVTEKWMLKRNPVKIYLNNYYNPMFGSQLRLCKSKDPNDCIYLFDHEDNTWIKNK